MGIEGKLLKCAGLKWYVTIPQVSPQLDSVATTADCSSIWTLHILWVFMETTCSATEDSCELHNVAEIWKQSNMFVCVLLWRTVPVEQSQILYFSSVNTYNELPTASESWCRLADNSISQQLVTIKRWLGAGNQSCETQSCPSDSSGSCQRVASDCSARLHADLRLQSINSFHPQIKLAITSLVNNNYRLQAGELCRLEWERMCPGSITVVQPF